EILAESVALDELAHAAAQVEEQTLLRGGGADLHQRARPYDVILDRRAYPPHRIGGKLHVAFGVEALHRFEQADRAFLHEIGERMAVAAVAPRDVEHETEMAGDQGGGGGGIASFEAAEQLAFFAATQPALA